MELNYIEMYQYECKQLDLYYRVIADLLDDESKK